MCHTSHDTDLHGVPSLQSLTIGFSHCCCRGCLHSVDLQPTPNESVYCLNRFCGGTLLLVLILTICMKKNTKLMSHSRLRWKWSDVTKCLPLSRQHAKYQKVKDGAFIQSATHCQCNSRSIVTRGKFLTSDDYSSEHCHRVSAVSLGSTPKCNSNAMYVMMLVMLHFIPSYGTLLILNLSFLSSALLAVSYTWTVLALIAEG